MTVWTTVLCSDGYEAHLIDAHAALVDEWPAEVALFLPAATEQQFQGKSRKTGFAEASQADTDSAAYHAELRGWLGEAIETVRSEWLAKKKGRRKQLWSSRNGHHRILPEGANEDAVDLHAWCAVSEAVSRPVMLLRAIGSHSECCITSVINRLVSNTSPEAHHAIELLAEAHHAHSSSRFLLPPHSSFLLSEMHLWHDQLLSLPRHSPLDLVLLDPPWPNKSARRSTSYETMDIYSLFSINLPSILSRNGDSPCLVAVWVTNKPKFRRFVTRRLFPDWQIELLADEWLWVKITDTPRGEAVEKGGLPVFDLDNSHRRAYEGLIIGRYNPAKAAQKEVPNRKVFLSVPLGHSRKPDVLTLLRPYLANPDTPTVLELFARMARPGPTSSTGQRGHWISVGNESIKHNQIGPYIRL